jgi:uncharacterized protein YbjT (DUF2867 family)
MRLFSFIKSMFLVSAILISGCASGSGSSDTQLVLVAGATGQTGSLIVEQLQENGYQVRALVRDMERGREKLGENIQYAEGDVRDIESIKAAMSGVSALISAIGAGRSDPSNGPEFVDYQGVKTLAEASAEAGLQQMVLVSSSGVTHEDHMLNKMFNNVLIWKLKGEDALRASGVPYTIVRPGGLVNTPAGQEGVAFAQGDKTGGRVSRADVAAICVAALSIPEAKNRTFETFANGELPNDWQAKFAALAAD